MGLVGGTPRQYDGPRLGQASEAWKCPACGAEQVGDPTGGCPLCGAGVAKAYKAVDAAIDAEAGSGGATEVTQAEANEQPTTPAPAAFTSESTHPEFEAWWARFGERLSRTLDPFNLAFAAWAAATDRARGRTMAAPPVTADLAQLAPDGKVARTVIAALTLFRDQVLRDAAEEIASGEWCAIAEVDQLINQLEETH
jgi:hypothetical protein